MQWLILGLLVFVGILRFVLPHFTKKSKRAIEFPYKRNSGFLTPAESSFFRILEKAAGDKLRVFPKVRLADVIKVRYGLSKTENRTAFNRIKSKHLDFVACGAGDLEVKFAVELDDSSHKKPSRVDRDSFVDRALDAAGIPVFHFQAKRAYSIEELREAICELPCALGAG